MQNSTGVPIDIMLVKRGEKGSQVLYTVAAFDSFSLPIESSFTDLIFVRPSGFNYNWSAQGISWRSINENTLVCLITCNSMEKGNPIFRFQLNSEIHTRDKNYPNLTMKLLPPFILENLLPFDFKYYIVDRNTKQEHRSVLAKGERDSLHTLDPTHLLGLSLSITEKGLRQKEVAIITSSDLQYRDETLVLYDSNGRQLHLKIKYSDNLLTEGRVVTIYTPYLLLNKTGLSMEFSVKSLITSSRSAAGQDSSSKNQITEADQLVEPLMFAYSNYEPLRSRTRIRVADSDWSKALSFEAVGSAFKIAVPKGETPLEYQLGIDIQEGNNKHYLTRVVTFTPRFLMKNNTDEDIYYRQAGTMSQILIKAKSVLPIVELRKFEDLSPQMCIRLENMMSEWSNPFAMDDIGTIFVKVGRIESPLEDLIRVDIAIEKATLFISFSKQDKKWPIRIDNQTRSTVTIRQTNAKKQYSIPKGESLSYAWDYPSLPHKALILSVNDVERVIETSKLGKLMPLKYPLRNSNRNEYMSIDLVADGPTIVLKLTPFVQGKSRYRLDDNAKDVKEKQEFTLVIKIDID